MRTTLLSTIAALALAAPALAQDPAPARATVVGADGVELGVLELVQSDNTIIITGDLAGLPPGEHGIHFHAVGECDAAAAFESAGDHFNPTDHQHGLENPDGPHAGDLPNLTVGDDGSVSVDLTSEHASLREGEDAYLFDEDGSALVIHADTDDQMTDPSGNSGDRIACAVIEAAL